jgi:hypothetical protein
MISKDWLKNIAADAKHNPKEHSCNYCGKGFVHEKTLETHVCEKKRRMLQKNDKAVRLGFYAFQRFYRLSLGQDGEKTYESFVDSNYYSAFVKFGSFLSNVSPLYSEKFIDYIVTSNIKIDKWRDERLYENYVLAIIKKENPMVALERSIKTMNEWSEKNSLPWHTYFTECSKNRIVWDIKDGKMSPWLVLNCDTGKQCLSSFSDEQLVLVYEILNPQYWTLKFKKSSADIEFIKQIAKESKL